MKNIERKLNDESKVFIIYDWSSEEVKIVTYNSDKAYAQIGQDVLAGDNVDEYRFIEIDLNEVVE